jgi:DNA-binding transcriptional LysR family regulator
VNWRPGWRRDSSRSQALGQLESSAEGSLGELRINVFADAAHLLIEPAIPRFVRQCPQVRLTIVVDDKPIDIVSEGYDAGIRYGHYVPEGMVTAPHARASLGGRSLAGLSGPAWTAAHPGGPAAAPACNCCWATTPATSGNSAVASTASVSACRAW